MRGTMPAAGAVLVAVLGAVAVGCNLQRDAEHPLASGLSTDPPAIVVSPGTAAPPRDVGESAQPVTDDPVRSPGVRAVAAALPVAIGDVAIGTGDVQMAPGPDGGLYVAVSRWQGGDAETGRTVLALLDTDGQPRPGWPIALEGWTCANIGSNPPWPPAPVDDGSVVVVCDAQDPSAGSFETRAFAFDASGRSTDGWTVPGDGVFDHEPRVVEGELHAIKSDATATWLAVVAADGSVRSGTPFEYPEGSSFGPFQVGPDGTAYRVNRMDQVTEITAFDLAGVRPGWPIRIEGITSEIAFGPDGRIYVQRASQDRDIPRARKWTLGPTQTLVFDQEGQSLPVGSDPLPVGADSGWTGAAEFDAPAAPLVTPDGTVFVVSGHASSYGESEPCCRTTIFRLDPEGTVVPGWPYEVERELQWQGRCSGLDTGCGVTRAWPTVGPGNVLHVLHGAEDPASGGGSVVAIGADGQVIQGWPVTLDRPGSEFRSVVVGPAGTAYVLAVEPEPGGRSSATILALDPDSSVRYAITVAQP